MDKSQIKKTQIGTVISDKMTNTAVIEVEVWKIHRVIKKRYKRHNRFMAENPDNAFKTGDIVKIVESRPLSKNKRWTIVGKAKKEELA
ncbi:MAG: 30S ribosomal protein S17 [Patescibacteria group bacterium]